MWNNRLVFLTVFIIIQQCGSGPLKYLEGNTGNNSEELLSVVVLFRHGDRAPSISFPNDPYFNESFWPMGYGQLTKKGKDRLYQLGKWFRNRYINFLPQKYSPKDIYIRSTNIDRCLMSASATLAGLYHPEESDQFNPDLSWQPIPVHTKSPRNDEVLAMRKPCRRYSQSLRKAMDCQFFKNIPNLYSNFLRHVSEYTGLSKITMEDIRTVHTVLDCYASYNSSFLPLWTKDLHKKTLQYLAGVAHGRYTFTRELRALLTGPFWANLIAFFDGTINSEDLPKFVMLSGHDTTVVSLLNGMGVYDLEPPVFGATIIWELRKREGDIFVRVLYKRNGSEAEVLEVAGCESDCDYMEFKHVLEPITVDSELWEIECQNEEKYGSSKPDDKKFDMDRRKRNNTHKPFFID